MYYLNTIKSKPSRSDPKPGSQGGKSRSSVGRKLKKARLETTASDPPTEGADTEEGGDLNAEEVEVRAVKSLLLPSSYYHHHLFYK